MSETALTTRTKREELAETLGLALDQLTDRDAQALLFGGDLGKLPPHVQTAYALYRCRLLDLDPMSRPFDLIVTKQGKTILYANRSCTDQLRDRRGITEVERIVERDGDILTIWLKGRDAHGREEWNCGSVFIGTMKGEELALSTMKCMTKAKRRLVLSMSGSGLMDETEVESVPQLRSLPSHFPETPSATMEASVVFDRQKPETPNL